MDAAKDTIEMSEDYITLAAVMEDNGLTAKWLASQIGRGQSTVYKYLAGELTIPSIVWARLFAKTRDERIWKIVTGDVPVVLVDIAVKEDIYDRLDAPTLKQICRVRKEQIAVEEAILEIIADGKVTKDDAAAIERFKRNHEKALVTQCKIHHGIVAAYERSVR